jgi:asparagine synthase (glutamine-hydrolysing)
VHNIATTLRAHDVPTLYRNLVSHWDPAAVIPGTEQPGGALWDTSITQDFPELLSYMQFLDLVTYLPDDILTKVDRASMAVALEARVPLIDHRVVEFAWRLPKQAKIRNGKSKWLLRQVLYRHVPEHLVERPKMGFGIPLADWLRGPLKDWAAHLLDERRLKEAGIVDPAVVSRYWDEHQCGTANRQHHLWGVLMLEAWREHWLPS